MLVLPFQCHQRYRVAVLALNPADSIAELYDVVLDSIVAGAK